VHRALAKKPDDRFESAQAMRKVLEAVRAEVDGSGSPRISPEMIARSDRSGAITLDSPTSKPTPSVAYAQSVEGAELPTNTSRTGLIAMAVAGLLALVGLGYVATQTGESTSEPATPPTTATPTETTALVAPPATSEVERPAPQTSPDAGASLVAEEETTTPPSQGSQDGESPRGTGARFAGPRPDTHSSLTSMATSGAGISDTAMTDTATTHTTVTDTTVTETGMTETEGGTPRFRDLDY
jgi:hypothetical protein